MVQVEENIASLYVEMYEALGMDIIDGFGYRFKDHGSYFFWKNTLTCNILM